MIRSMTTSLLFSLHAKALYSKGPGRAKACPGLKRCLFASPERCIDAEFVTRLNEDALKCQLKKLLNCGDVSAMRKGGEGLFWTHRVC